MKNFTTCICIMGLSGVAAADVLMDQIGDMDGSGIADNIMASQDFEAAYDVYDVVVADDFAGDGSAINSVELVLGGWNGFVDPSSIAGYTANLYSGSTAAGASLTGDIASQYVDAADATVSADWAGANFLVGMATDMASNPGDQLVGIIPSNDFATGGQTGLADSLLGNGVNAWQANPGGGFGFGAVQDAGAEGALRIAGGAPADPCTFPLPATCAADVDGDGSVAVSDVLAIIGAWGDCGDGTYRPTGDIAPMPNGDCCVTVADVLAVVGNWGADCSVYGSCCMSDGSCSEMTDMACMDAGGSWVEGGDCATADCVAAACCLSSTTCEDLTEDSCVALGGSYKGDGTACATTDCAAVEAGDECTNAWIAVDGANAFDTSNCTPSGNAPTDELCAGTFLEWGASNDGWFMYVASGGLTTFDTCDAASYDTSLVLYEGSCDNQVACNGDAADTTGCQAYSSDISNYACVAGETYYIRIGSWQGAEQGAGTLNITPPSTGFGACCFADETCIDVLAADCDAFGGFFQGDATECASGICEAGPGDECDSATEAMLGANPYDTSLATASEPAPDETQCEGTYLEWGASPDMWMYWVATGSGTASFDTCDVASYDTSIVLYEGTCDNQIACDGDSGAADCQLYSSLMADIPVTEGTTYYIRLGGWQGATGAGTLNISLIGGDAVGACCMTDGSCMDYISADCLAAGGSWDSTIMCADASCPQPYAGCDSGVDNCDACWVDGDDATTDCNGGATPQNIDNGVAMCGSSSVYNDVGGLYRDLDWYYNASLNAGGTFTISAGSSGIDLLFGVVTNADSTFVAAFVMPGGYEGSVDIDVPAGDYSLVATCNEWNAAWTCASGLTDYSIQLD
jgi:hypothetical protein